MVSENPDRVSESVGGTEAAKPFVIRMPADLHAALKAKAAAEERSMAQAIRWAIWLYVTEDDHRAETNRAWKAAHRRTA